jgi:hypothetical protein
MWRNYNNLSTFVVGGVMGTQSGGIMGTSPQYPIRSSCSWENPITELHSGPTVLCFLLSAPKEWLRNQN